ncbi:MAG TPA: hypothetical protein VNJ01_18145 [Bacteriovoracaceae bacterium]|nr:hypothetical protein [Bacteriovoracaceae bacterium]
MKLIVIMLFCVSTSLRAETVSQVLDLQVALMHKKMGSGTSLAMAKNGLKNDVRNESFAIQAIARLFQKENRVFNDLKTFIKSFEDQVGKIERWVSLQAQPGLSEAQKSELRKNMQQELKNFSVYLETSSFYRNLDGYRSAVAALRISEADTRRIVVKGIKSELKEVLTRRYDFTHGEEGLHELRRNLRWPLMEFDAFKASFSTTKTSCRSSVFYTYGVKSHYTTLTTNPTAPYNIDYCSYVELSGAVIVMGEIKDDLERRGIMEHKLPSEIVRMSSKIYDDLRRDILPLLIKF